MREGTCFKAHIYGRCDYCKEWNASHQINIINKEKSAFVIDENLSLMFKEVQKLIEQYPEQVKELIDNNYGR